MPRTRRAEAEFTSYYGRPVINPPIWEELDIGGYLFLGGLAGSSSIIAAAADLTGRRAMARVSRVGASAAISLSLLALIHDLGRPARFLHMLRVFKPSSPMSVGVWILVGYAPLTFGATAAEFLEALPDALGRVAGIGAGVLGAGVASYTAALVADTAVPAWHGGFRELPFLFVGSAATAGAGWALAGSPARETVPVRRLAVAGACVELVAEQLMERSLGMVSETLETGAAGRKMRAAKALTALGAAGAALAAGRSRPAAALAGAALVAGSLCTRLGIFEAGMESARDPRYTVVPQRERLESRPAAATV
ncbi:MAG TPA: NrfD/PsrC family molybdoenzyme membrane anchor subunit [Solirubrobacteraceae bacterium]|nr:NrfD/PsrC family molybdoenzyme membrane anchor subunit [Solirubrobacteraceae bacterium]